MHRDSESVDPVAHPVPAIETTRLILPGGIPLQFCRIPAGTFWMGSRERLPAGWDNPAPPHQVRIEDAFRISMHSLLSWRPHSVPTDGGWTQGQNRLQPRGIIPDTGMGDKRLSAEYARLFTCHSRRSWKQPKSPDGMLARRGDRPPGLSVLIPVQAAQPREPPLPRNDIRSTNPR